LEPGGKGETQLEPVRVRYVHFVTGKITLVLPEYDLIVLLRFKHLHQFTVQECTLASQPVADVRTNAQEIFEFLISDSTFEIDRINNRELDIVISYLVAEIRVILPLYNFAFCRIHERRVQKKTFPYFESEMHPGVVTQDRFDPVSFLQIFVIEGNPGIVCARYGPY
jgi:hypothetical protein